MNDPIADAFHGRVLDLLLRVGQAERDAELEARARHRDTCDPSLVEESEPGLHGAVALTCPSCGHTWTEEPEIHED